MRWLFLILIMISLFLVPQKIALANDQINSNQFITLVNPVRISEYNTSPEKSLSAEYQAVHQFNLPATWLLTYDAISNKNVSEITKNMDPQQELGILLEISPNFTKDVNIKYKETDSWHRAKALFLSGYTQKERIIFIDTVFNKFKQTFGFFPKSVGAWWVDSYSLEYMQKKYGITASLNCSDQFFTDGYSIWGQYWSTPFYPNKTHAGLPANSLDNKLNLVMLQWAARDPINGYGKNKASTYSTQDYHTHNLPIEYYEKLIRIYTQNSTNKFGQITLGLESDLSESAYQGLFTKHLSLIQKLKDNEGFKVTTMQAFSNWYQSSFPKLSPPQVIETEDPLGTKLKSFWYQSPNYRLGLIYNPETSESKIIDLRIYPENFQEPFYQSPNNQMDLFINLPSLIDTATNKNSAWVVDLGELTSTSGTNQDFVLHYQGNKSINFKTSAFSFDGANISLPKSFNQEVTIEKRENITQIIPQTTYQVNPDGILIRNFPPIFLYLANNFKQPKVLLPVIIFSGGYLLLILFFGKRKNFKSLILLLAGTTIFILLTSKSYTYYISQEESVALNYLKALPDGNILVINKFCLKCTWHSNYMPQALVNIRDYVSTISQKKIIYSQEILPQPAVKYIYLVKYESYIEELPNLINKERLEKIYENANAQIWQVL